MRWALFQRVLSVVLPLTVALALTLVNLLITAGQYWWVERARHLLVDDIAPPIQQLDATMKNLLDWANAQPAQLRGGHDPRELQEMGVLSREAKKAERTLRNREIALATLGTVLPHHVALWVYNDVIEAEERKLLETVNESGVGVWLKAWAARNADNIANWKKQGENPSNSSPPPPSSVNPGY